MPSILEMRRGLPPSIIGIFTRRVTEEIIQAHNIQQTTSALKILMRARIFTDMPPEIITAGEMVFIIILRDRRTTNGMNGITDIYN